MQKTVALRHRGCANSDIRNNRTMLLRGTGVELTASLGPGTMKFQIALPKDFVGAYSTGYDSSPSDYQYPNVSIGSMAPLLLAKVYQKGCYCRFDGAVCTVSSQKF